MLHRKKESKLPTFKSAQELANRFADYFSNKIEKIIQSFDTSTTTQDSTCSNYTGTCFNNFSPISEDQLKKIILGGNSKWCHLDPVPTEVLKQVIDCIIPTLTTIVNISLQTCTFPQHLKSATVVPLLKKSTLDAEEEKNYRPVSNLAYVSKLIERVAVDQLHKHMDANNLHESCQSAYRKGHSTETALLKINNDLLCAMDNSQCVLLVMLDLSAAFDTVSHSTLLSRMDKLYGVRGDALLWLQSYFAGRIKSVMIGGIMSAPKSSRLAYHRDLCLGLLPSHPTVLRFLTSLGNTIYRFTCMLMTRNFIFHSM